MERKRVALLDPQNQKMAGRDLWTLLFVLLLAVSSVCGYFVNVDAHAQECFFDKASSGMKMGLTFEVVEGGFLDIDVTVINSN